MLHAEVDLKFYREELESFLARERRCFHVDITNPYHLISNEIIRNKQRLYKSELDRVPTDLVLFSPIAAHRAVTKLGGLPYRNRDLPWPNFKFMPPTKGTLPFHRPLSYIYKRIASRVYSVLFAWGRQLIFVHEFFWENKLYLSSHLRLL